MPLGIKLTLRAIECQVLGSLAMEFAVFHALAKSERLLQVTRKVRESEDVTSFYLKPLYGEDQKLCEDKPGQHLPIHRVRGNKDVLMRTYSLSSGKNWGECRISVE